MLYRCDGDGGNLHPVSSNPDHDNTPWVLPDGRVVHQRWEYIDRSQVHFHHLWVMNPDGTGQMVYFGNMHPSTVMIDAKPIPGSDRIVAIFSPGHGRREHAGPICIVDPNNGPDAPPSVTRIGRGGNFRDPYALSQEHLLAAEGRRLVLVHVSGLKHVLHELPPEQGRLELHEPRPLRPRRREPVFAPKSDPAKATGRLVLADVGIGRNMAGVKRGEIRKLLVLEALPKPINYTGGMDPISYGGTFMLERVVGTVPVSIASSLQSCIQVTLAHVSATRPVCGSCLSGWKCSTRLTPPVM